MKKKVVLGITGLAILVFIFVLTVSSQDGPDKTKDQASTEVITKTSHCGSSAACTLHAENHKTECDHEKCDPENCDENCTGKCDHDQCAGNCMVVHEPGKCQSSKK